MAVLCSPWYAFCTCTVHGALGKHRIATTWLPLHLSVCNQPQAKAAFTAPLGLGLGLNLWLGLNLGLGFLKPQSPELQAHCLVKWHAKGSTGPLYNMAPTMHFYLFTSLTLTNVLVLCLGLGLHLGFRFPKTTKP